MRNALVFFLLIALILASFLIWGDWFTTLLSLENVLAQLEQFGNWGWALAIAMLVGDVFLPVPATIVMSVLGYLYGPIAGGLLATAGNFLAGMAAYLLCRAVGEKGALRLLGERDLAQGRALFNRRGGWIVAISRWLPILPEAVACMAGLNRMRPGIFMTSLLCGSLPLGFAFAFIGYSGVTQPYLAVLASAVLPLMLWVIAQYVMRLTMRKART